MRGQQVEFKDFLVNEDETDSGKPDLKSMQTDLPDMIKEIHENNPLKTYLRELFMSEIVATKNLDRVTEFFSLVWQILEDSKVNSKDLDTSSSDSDCHKTNTQECRNDITKVEIRSDTASIEISSNDTTIELSNDHSTA